MALKRSSNKMIAGVIAGIAEEYDIDISLLRLIFAIILFFTGLVPGIIFYVAAMIIFPNEDDNKQDDNY